MRFTESPALAKLHHILSKLAFCFRKLYPTASRNLRAVVQFHHTACCPLVFRISVAQFYHTAYCPLVFRISIGQFHHTQHTALWFSVSQDGCPISLHTHSILPYCPLVFRISRQLPNFTTHTTYCCLVFRISGHKLVPTNFTTDSTLPF